MRSNGDIYLLVGDLGYKVFDVHFRDYEKNCINCGAAEQSMLDIAIGLAYDGKIPVCYSITSFLLYRAFEAIRTYVNYEKLNIKLIGSGRDYDYKHDGISHHSADDKAILSNMTNIKQFWPMEKREIPHLVTTMLKDNQPYYINLTR